MNNIIAQIAEIITKSFESNLEKMITEKKDISEFILEIKKSLDESGRVLVVEALETLDSLVKDSAKRKQNWYVHEKSSSNTLATIFGEIHYKRTYYKNKKEKEYRYLSDELVGIGAYDKMDLSLKARLIEEAIDTPYARSGIKASEAIEISRQSVMNSIRELGPVSNGDVKITKAKTTPKVIYIEADEDHVALQTGNGVEPKLIYVHEGKQQVGKNRWHLQNIRYFGGMYKETEELWNEVADYIDQAYDMDKVDKIYISGDGASWIKSGANYIAKSTFVLDKYHLNKAIKVAGGHLNNAEKSIWKAIIKRDKTALDVAFETIEGLTEADTKIKAINDSKRYILNHWETLKFHYQSDYIGCSAEGHISHIYSDRLSSRPLGWSYTGVDQMSRLRVYVANGGKVYDLALRKKQERMKGQRVKELDLRVKNRRPRTACDETMGNLPVLNTGRKTQLALALHSIRGI